MDKKTIYSKTGKGVLEIKNKAGKIAKDLVRILTLIDGKSSVAELIAKSGLNSADMDRSLAQLSAGGYIKEFSNTSSSAPTTPSESSYVDDLDFTSSLAPGKNPYQSAQTEFRQRESADRVKAEQEAKLKREEEERLKKEQALRQARDEAARLAKVEAERKAKEAAALKLREEAERKAKIEAEAMAQTQRDLAKILEAERKALEQTDRKRQQETERDANENAERRDREYAERRRREEEERQAREEEERRRRDEEERKRKEEEERKRKEDEERRRRDEEERIRKDEEERKRREEEERKRREEEERKRREEEERKRREEEERKKREEEERKKREEDERKKREEDERRQRREEEDRRRAEEDQRRRREDEERRQREEVEARRSREEQGPGEQETDERARSEAVAKNDLPEFDLSGLRSMESQIASEFEKQQAELRRREEEEERRFLQQEEARRALERAEREEEARLEAERREAEDRERRERMERERQDREARERKRQEEKELRVKEQEERRVKAELDRKRQEEMKIESERKAREDELSRRRKEQEERDRKRAEVQSLKKQKAIRTPLERFRPLVIGIVVVVALVVGGIQVIPMNAYIPSMEKLASDHIGEPVTIGSIRVSVLGGFTMNLDNVRLGTTQDVKIDNVELTLDFGALFGDVKVIQTMSVESASVAEEVLPRLSKWMAAAIGDRNLQIRRFVFKGTKLESRTLKLPNFDAQFDISPEGVVQNASVETSDGKLSVQITPRGAEFDIVVSASKDWVPPIGPQVEFTDFSAKAVGSRNQIRVEEFRALLYGGAVKGSALINWGGPWSIDGQLTAERIALQQLMPVFTQDAKSSGQMEAALRFTLAAPDLETLFDTPRTDGTFLIRKGDLDGVDLVRALQMGGRQNVQGGATRFEEISGTVSIANRRYQYRNLKLASGLLSATGGFEVLPSKDVDGRVYVELRSAAAQIHGNFTIDGNLKAVVLKPN